MGIYNKARAVIRQGNKILLVKDINTHSFVLPGGTHELGETIKECFEREIYEELGIKPITDKLISVREWTNSSGSSSVDYWFTIKNNHDYFIIHQDKCSHGNEWEEYGYFDIEKLEKEFPMNEILKRDLQKLKYDTISVELI